MVGGDGLTGGVHGHVLGDEDGEDGLGEDAGDGGLVDAEAEEQVGKGVDEDDEPGASVHEALQGRGDAGVDDRHEVSRPDAMEKGGDEAEDGERDEHREHRVERVGDRRRDALAQVDAKLLVLGELHEDRRGGKSDDDCAEQAVRTGEVLAEHAGDVVGADAGELVAGGNLAGLLDALLDLVVLDGDDLGARIARVGVGELGHVRDACRGGADGLRHHDEQRGDTDDHAGDRVLEALVARQAVADDAGEHDGRDV